MCTDRTFNKHINEAAKIKAEIAALKAELEKHTDFIKEEMTARELETYKCGKNSVVFKEIIKKRLDQKSLKEALPEIVKQFTIDAPEKRLTINH